jgi:4'-phosphopantetheinyl transferase
MDVGSATCGPPHPSSSVLELAVGPVGRPLDLPEGELHLWVISLVKDDTAARASAEILTEEERERARSFRFDRHRRRFVAGRTALRNLLGSYLGEEPARLRFEYGPYGKPALTAGAGPPTRAAGSVRFNLSHCEESAVCAVVRGAEVGVDLERVRGFPSMEAVAASVFSPEERAAMERAPPEQRAAAFFRCWTCKEALLKAVGSGLSGDPGAWVVDVDAAGGARVLRAGGTPPSAWSLHPFVLSGDLMGALAVRGPLPAVKGWRYEPP